MSREEKFEMMRMQIKVIDADRMAAIVDEMVRARQLDARSKLADARLDYGKPFDPEGMRQGAEMLESTRTRADYWLEGGRDDANRDTAVLSVEQAANAWKNAAYALAEKLAKTTPPEVARIGETPRTLALNLACGRDSLSWDQSGPKFHALAEQLESELIAMTRLNRLHVSQLNDFTRSPLRQIESDDLAAHNRHAEHCDYCSVIAPCPYCTSDNEAIRSTYYDQTCEGCVKRMGQP